VANRKERREAARSKDNNNNTSEVLEPDAVLGGGEGGDAVPFPDHEEDVLFKTQMRVLNALLGHWKIGLAIVGVVLLSVLVFGEYDSYIVNQQRGYQGQIADIDRRMPEAGPAERFLGGAGEGLTPEVKANVEEGARRYEAVAANAVGTGATMAWIRAGGAWERAGDQDKARKAFEGAHAVGSTGVVGWSAANQFSAAQAGAGDADGAIATLKSLSGKVTGLMAAQIEMGIATTLEDAGRTSESKAAFEAFLVAHPQSILVEQAKDGIRRLGAGE
jgi:hypothetical protein